MQYFQYFFFGEVILKIITVILQIIFVLVMITFIYRYFYNMKIIFYYIFLLLMLKEIFN
jgi:hypothetical protein